MLKAISKRGEKLEKFIQNGLSVQELIRERYLGSALKDMFMINYKLYDREPTIRENLTTLISALNEQYEKVLSYTENEKTRKEVENLIYNNVRNHYLLKMMPKDYFMGKLDGQMVLTPDEHISVFRDGVWQWIPKDETLLPGDKIAVDGDPGRKLRSRSEGSTTTKQS